jgi:hypothetical protein
MKLVILLIPPALVLLGFLWWPSLPSHWTALSPFHWLLLGLLYVVLEVPVEGFRALVVAPFRRRRRSREVIVDKGWLARKKLEQGTRSGQRPR